MRPEGRIDWSAGRGRPRFPGRSVWLRGQCRAGHVPVSASRSRERRSPKARSWLKSPSLRRATTAAGAVCVRWFAQPSGGRLQSRCGAQYCSLEYRVPECPFQSVHATPGAASLGCSPGSRSPWRMSWSRWRMRWSGGYVDPQLGGEAGQGGVLRPKGAGGPGAAPSLACASSRTPVPDQLPRGPSWKASGMESSSFSHCPHFGVAPVWPLWKPRHACGRRAGQGKAGQENVRSAG